MVELIRYQSVEPVPVDAARHHVIHQPRQITGQRQCRCRPADHQRRRDRRLGPSRDEPGKRQPAVEFAEFRGNVERRSASKLFGLVRKRQFVFVDVAERDDARQHHRIGPQFIKEDITRHAKRAPGRQIERYPCELGRLAPRLKAFDQPAVDQRSNDAAQERHGQGNAEDAHGLFLIRGSGANIEAVIIRESG